MQYPSGIVFQYQQVEMKIKQYSKAMGMFEQLQRIELYLKQKSLHI